MTSIDAPRSGIQVCSRDVPGTNRGISRPFASSSGLPSASELVVGLEDVAAQALRVAADARRGEVLEAALDLVGAQRRATRAGATRSRSAGGCCALPDRSSRSTARCIAGSPARRARRASGTASRRSPRWCRRRSAAASSSASTAPSANVRGAEHPAPGRRDDAVGRRRRGDRRRVDGWRRSTAGAGRSGCR